ncbi:MAG: hypothetical protein LC685_01820, partial [Actinobacteria bacterium]|nr:hypothetical protein [Actinomycetota bacterium]
QETLRMCFASKGQPDRTTPYGALRVTLTLATQPQLNDLIRTPERYRIDVLADGAWRPAQFLFECHAQE